MTMAQADSWVADQVEQHEYAYLTTTGRVSGTPHRIRIWFAVMDGCLWVNSGGRHRSDWVKNVMADQRLDVQIGAEHWKATATIRDDAVQHTARERLAERYQGWRPGQPLSQWATQSLLIQIEVTDGSR